MKNHDPTHRVESPEEKISGHHVSAQPTGDKLALRKPPPVLKLERLHTIVRGRTHHIMASLITPLPQELPSPLSDYTFDEKSTPATPYDGDKAVMAINDLVPSLPNKEVDTQLVTRAMRRKAWLQFAALCWAMFVCGWNDGTTGPLIPRLQEVYHVGGIHCRCRNLLLTNHPAAGIVQYFVPHFHGRLHRTYTALLRAKLHAINHRHNRSRATSPVPPYTSTSQTALGSDRYDYLPARLAQVLTLMRFTIDVQMVFIGTTCPTHSSVPHTNRRLRLSHSIGDRRLRQLPPSLRPALLSVRCRLPVRRVWCSVSRECFPTYLPYSNLVVTVMVFAALFFSGCGVKRIPR